MSKQAVETKGKVKTHQMYYRDVNDNKGTKRRTKSSKFKLLWDFKEPYKTRKSNELNKLSPISSEILFDIDSESLTDGMDTLQKLAEYMHSEYNAIGDVYYSGKKGFHCVYRFTKQFEFTSEPPKDNKKTNTIKEYALLLNEIGSAIDIKLDVSLQEVTRLIQIPNIKKDNSAGRGYKILIGNTESYCNDIEKIKSSSKDNRDIGKPAECDNTELYDHLKELSQMELHSESNTFKLDNVTVTADKENTSVFTEVFNTINQTKEKHKTIFIIGVSLNGYCNIEEVNSIYEILKNTTPIEESVNSYNSFIDAFRNDRNPFNLGNVYNALKDVDMDLFFRFKKKLQSYANEKGYNAFVKILQDNDNDPLKIYEKHLTSYLNNNKNLLKGIIYCLSSLLGLQSQIVNVNGEAGGGKSEYVDTIRDMIPNIEKIGDITEAVFRRSDKFEYHRKIVYIGDTGLNNNLENLLSVLGAFGALVTDKDFPSKRLSKSDKIEKFDLYSDGITVFLTKPYMNMTPYKMGEQLKRRTKNIMVNTLSREQELQVYLNDDDNKQFKHIHKNYISHLVQNYEPLEFGQDLKKYIHSHSDDLNETKENDAYFKTYCAYLQLEPTIENYDSYRKIFKNHRINPIEMEWLKMLLKWFNPQVTVDGLEIQKNMISQTKDKGYKVFFTVKTIKTYIPNWKRNKKLLNSVDELSDILVNLFNADYLGQIKQTDYSENVYYINLNDLVDEVKNESE